jgi:mannitol-1-phosphate 5-dehydrogenase
MNLAMQFGAGNIGRGFMGQLFFEAGYDTVFVDNNKELVADLTKARQYTLHLLDAYSKKEVDMVIRNFSALHTDQSEQIAESFSKAEVVGTAVGVKNLQAISHLIAEGIALRSREGQGPVDIYLCENAYSAAQDLKRAVYSSLAPGVVDWASRNIGFVGTSVARMVPAASNRFKGQGPLFVVADSYHRLPYDGNAVRAPRPPVEGMKAVRNFKAEVERKLFTYNLGHAALAYIGYLKGYSYVHEPFSDPYLFSIFEQALDETTRALLKMYPEALSADEQEEIREDVRLRFSNPMILDTVQRVARDPVRKLGPEDRLIGSAKLCLAQGIFPGKIAFICGAAFCYDYPEDAEAVKLQNMIEVRGIDGALQEVSGIDPESEFGKKIISSYQELVKLKKQWRK